MTSLDQALIRVFAKDDQPSPDNCDQRDQPERELYVRPTDSSADHEAPEPISELSTTIDNLMTIGNTADLVSETFIVDTAVSPFADSLTSDEYKSETSQPMLESGVEEMPASGDLLSIDESEPDRVETADVQPATPDRQDNSRATMKPAIARIPEVSFKAAWEVDGFRLPSPCQQIHECLQDELYSVRSLLRDTAFNEQKLINIHSWSQGEGRTTLAIGLAHFMAQHGQKVLIIDANHDHPTLAETLGLSIEFGWEKFVSGEEPLDECCVRSIQDGFSILPMVNSEWSIGDLGFGQTLRTMIDSLIDAFDLILLDTAAGRPVWSTEIEDITAAHLVVRDVRHTSDDDVMRMKRHLSQHSNQIVETVENFSAVDQVTLKKTA